MLDPKTIKIVWGFAARIAVLGLNLIRKIREILVFNLIRGKSNKTLDKLEVILYYAWT